MRKSPILIALILIVSLSTTAFAADTTSSTPAPSGVVNINSADAAQLANLPRVGMKAAERIVEYRKQHGAFARVTDLMQVKGFGEKTFERLRPYLTVDGKTTLTAKVHGARKPRNSKSAKLAYAVSR